jgi:hypothetical protein
MQRHAAFLVERIKPSQDIDRLSHHQPHLRPVERDLFEGKKRSAIGHVPLHARLIDPMGGDGDPGLDATLQLDESQLHVNGRTQLRMSLFQLLKFEDFTGFGSWRALWPILMRLMHPAILVQVAVGSNAVRVSPPCYTPKFRSLP